MRGRTERTPERVAEVRRLREQGLMWKDIGERMGIALQTAHAWYSDPDGAQIKARKESYRGTCVECGATTGGDIKGGRTYCFDCGSRIGGAKGAATMHQRAEPRQLEMAEMYRAGASLKEMASHFGMAVGTVAHHVHRLRAMGYDLPYRYRVENGRRLPERQAA